MRTLMLISIMMFIFAPHASISAVDESLVLYLPLDEATGGAVKDYSNHGNDGILEGGAKLVKGKIGNAVELNGNDAYVEVQDHESFAGKAATVEAWFNTTSNSNFPIIWKEKTASGGDVWVRIEPGSSRIRCLFRDKEDKTLVPATTSAYNDGQWHHMAATVADGKARIYIDGNLENEASGPFGEFDSGQNLVLGVRYLDQLDTFATGMIDEARFWTRALSQDEIKTNMNKGKEKFAAVSSRDKLATIWGRIKVTY